MRRSLLTDPGNWWHDDYQRYPILAYAALCLLILWLKLSNAFPMSWEQGLLPLIAVGIVTILYYIGKGLNHTIPDAVLCLGMRWRQLAPGNTMITQSANGLRVALTNLSWSVTPFKAYGQKMTESRSRQGFWLKP
ncbi:MAG: hypothetical protein WCV85_04420 [Patescibacteria group bacterium]|jgi:disulfide bond formation protein DsbB